MFTISKIYLRLIIVTLVSLSCIGGATQAAALQTDPITVTATRFATSIETAPVNTSIITAEDIAKSNATTLADVLRYQAGVNISALYGTNGSHAKIDLGGFGGNSGQNTLVLLNGRRMNDLDLQTANIATIPLENISRVEIVYGSSTVLYGDNAVSGVINIVTKNAYDQESGSFKLQAGSFQTSRLSLNKHKIIAGNALSIALDSTHSDGYRKNNAADNSNLMTELSRENAGTLYGLRANISRAKLELPGSLAEPAYLADATASSSKNSSQEFRKVLEAFIEAEQFAAELALHDKHQEANYTSSTSSADLETLSFTPRLNRQYGTQQLIAGIDFYRSHLDAKSTYNSQDVTQNSSALYLTDNIALGKNTHLNLGLRRQAITVNAKNVSSGKRSDAITVWDINLGHQYTNDVDNYIRVAKSFRSPTLDEMWNYTTGKFTFIKPQTGHHLETGTNKRFASGAKLSANLFRMDLEDEIAYDNGSFSNINLEKTRHDGINLDLHTPISEALSIHTGYSWRKATFRSGTNNGKVIPAIPEQKLTLAGQYQLDEQRQMGLNVIHKGQRYFGDDNSNSGKQLPAYTRWDASYTQRFSGWKGRFQVKNLTNVKTADSGFYRTASPNYYYYPLPERSFFLTIEGEL